MPRLGRTIAVSTTLCAVGYMISRILKPNKRYSWGYPTIGVSREGTKWYGNHISYDRRVSIDIARSISGQWPLIRPDFYHPSCILTCSIVGITPVARLTNRCQAKSTVFPSLRDIGVIRAFLFARRSGCPFSDVGVAIGLAYVHRFSPALATLNRLRTLLVR